MVDLVRKHVVENCPGLAITMNELSSAIFVDGKFSAIDIGRPNGTEVLLALSVASNVEI